MTNIYIKSPDGAYWIADEGIYRRMENGYGVEVLTEEEYKMRYVK